MDYYQEWSSARSFILHEPIYRPTLELARRDFGARSVNSQTWILGYNVHPPTSVLLAIPFGYLPYYQSFLAWSFFTLGLYAVCLWLIARNSDYNFGILSLLPLTCLCLLSSPFWHQFHQGQLNPLILIFITLGWMSVRSRNPWQAGLWLGLAAAVKVFPAFLGFYFLVRREWRYLAALVIGFTVTTLVTVAVLGVDTYRDYVKLVLPEALEWRSANTNASLAGLFNKLFDPGPRGGNYLPVLHSPLLAKLGYLLSWAVILGSMIPIWLRARTARQSDLAFSMAIVGMLLLSPVTWDHYFLLLPLPLICIWMNLPPQFRYRIAFFSILAGLNAPIYYWLSVYLSRPQFDHGVSPLYTVGLPSFSCYMLCGLFVLGHVAVSHAQRSLPE